MLIEGAAVGDASDGVETCEAFQVLYLGVKLADERVRGVEIGGEIHVFLSVLGEAHAG